MAEQCHHEPVNGKWNKWETASGKRYFRCRFCGAVIEESADQEEKTEGKILKAPTAYQRSVNYFLETGMDRHYTDDQINQLPLVPNKMRDHYRKWRDACPCPVCNLSRSSASNGKKEIH